MASIAPAAPASKMQRPKRYDEPIVQVAAINLAEEICRDWDHDGKPEDWVDSLVKCRFDWDDAYNLAKALERQSYVDADRNLVDVLDSAFGHLDRAHNDAVRKWIAIVGFTPVFATGDRVSCRHGEGLVRSVDMDRAAYVVATEGRDWGKGGGYVINAEDVTACNSDQSGEAGKTEGLDPKGASAGRDSGIAPTQSESHS